ncbi:MAG: hypothetical protein ACK4TC_09455 [Sphingomonas pseudosanguinis]|uniref:hypothetical protein n=1 Tax=Sphingomonas pseudosanguinis TaxID=413712 RepID=UPI00391DF376
MGGVGLFSGPIICATVATTLDPQPSMGIAVITQPVPALGDRITVATVCPLGAFVCVLDEAQAKMLIHDLTKGLEVLGRLQAGSPSGAVQ